MEHGRLVVDEELRARPSSVGQARRLVRAAVASSLLDDVAETAELLVSELVSNAVVHVGTPIDLRVSLPGPGSALVCVADSGPHLPVLRHDADTAGTGRGLRLVDERFEDWGVAVGGGGKTVWFRVSEAGSEAAPAHGDLAAGSARAESTTGLLVPGQSVDVELRGVPLLLHSEWQQRAAALLREYLLGTPTTLPVMRSFRRWVCRQVRDQASGKPPTPFEAG